MDELGGWGNGLGRVERIRTDFPRDVLSFLSG